jgi:L-rhamnose mutarotase
MTRMAFCIGLKPEHIADYKRLHAAVWPDVLRRITASHIHNYSIFLREPENLLFAYWDYSGTNFAADSAAMAADPMTQTWWEVCMPCQAPLTSRAEGEWWAGMEEVFHLD